MIYLVRQGQTDWNLFKKFNVRQGETDWNLFKKFNGCTDAELNQTGIAQAKLQAENLRSVSFDACFCSPQKRALQTCEIIYKGQIVFDDRLTEIKCGEFEGTAETSDSMKLFWQAIKSGDKGTESFMEFMKRSCDFCDMIAEDYIGKNVLIITHAANIRVIDYYFSGKPKDYDFNKPTAIGMSPKERWDSSLENGIKLRFFSPVELEEIFLHAQQRRVNKYGVVSFEGNTYEAPVELIGMNVIMRYNPFHLEYLHVYYQDKYFGTAKIIDLKTQRHKSVGAVPEESGYVV